MEWVETTGRTLEEAVEAALDQLGVAEEDLEYQVLDEPKAGLLGRLGGREARIRARVRPISREKPGDRRRTARPGWAEAGAAGHGHPGTASGRGRRRRVASQASGDQESGRGGRDGAGAGPAGRQRRREGPPRTREQRWTSRTSRSRSRPRRPRASLGG